MRLALVSFLALAATTPAQTAPAQTEAAQVSGSAMAPMAFQIPSPPARYPHAKRIAGTDLGFDARDLVIYLTWEGRPAALVLSFVSSPTYHFPDVSPGGQRLIARVEGLAALETTPGFELACLSPYSDFGLCCTCSWFSRVTALRVQPGWNLFGAAFGGSPINWSRGYSGSGICPGEVESVHWSYRQESGMGSGPIPFGCRPVGSYSPNPQTMVVLYTFEFQ